MKETLQRGIETAKSLIKTKQSKLEPIIRKPDMKYRFGRLHPTHQAMEKFYDKKDFFDLFNGKIRPTETNEGN